MAESNLITIIEHEGTMWERKYIVTVEEKELLDRMTKVAEEIKAYGRVRYDKIPEKKGSMTGLGNRIIRTVHRMMEDFDIENEVN